MLFFCRYIVCLTATAYLTAGASKTRQQENRLCWLANYAMISRTHLSLFLITSNSPIIYRGVIFGYNSGIIYKFGFLNRICLGKTIAKRIAKRNWVLILQLSGGCE